MISHCIRGVLWPLASSHSKHMSNPIYVITRGLRKTNVRGPIGVKLFDMYYQS